jgi:predicted transcriptional regulator
MKTAISLPDELFERADAYARRTGRTRSEVYAAALAEYLRERDDDQVTARLDAVAREVDTSLAADQVQAARRLLASEDW